MKKQITISAKSIEEALEKAVAELGAPNADAIEYKVIEEAKKGFLGIGATQAKIEASYEELSYGKAAAVAFINKLVEDMKLDAKVSVRDGDNGDTVISIDGESAGVLIGHHGDTLDSLQYLANLAANKKVEGEKKEYCKLTIDLSAMYRH